jgi:hypothetical protein
VRSYLIRVQLPDRPGALGAVASRIGSVGGDVVSIDILQRDDGVVVDEVGVGLAGEHLVDLVREEILEVDGVSIESIRPVEDPMPDRLTELLDVATDLFVQPTRDELLVRLAAHARHTLFASFAAVFDPVAGTALASDGETPDADELSGLARLTAEASPSARRGRRAHGPRRPRARGRSRRPGPARPRAPMDLDHGRAGRPLLPGVAAARLRPIRRHPPAADARRRGSVGDGPVTGPFNAAAPGRVLGFGHL